MRVTGRIDVRNASGAVRASTFSAGGQLTCDTGARHWRTTRSPGRIFAGSITRTGTVRPQARNGNNVRAFHTTVSTTRCTGSQAWLVPNIVITGGIEIGDGRFARPVEDTPAGLAVCTGLRDRGPHRRGARVRDIRRNRQQPGCGTSDLELLDRHGALVGAVGLIAQTLLKHAARA